MRHAIPAAAALLFAPTLALAHAQLQRATPAVGSTVPRPPAEVELTFSEAVEPRFSTIAVADASGKRIDKQDVHVVTGDAKRLAVGLLASTPGTYTVTWHATSVDTHKTEGSFKFTVAP